MDYPDLFRPSEVGQVALSPDGTQLLYTVTHSSYPSVSRNVQVHLASLDGSVERALTAGPDRDHRAPRWHPSGEHIAFTAISEEEQGGRQIFIMAPNEIESRQVTRVEGGVGAWGWSESGEWLAYLAGRDGERQLWILDGSGQQEPRQLTGHPTPITSFQWSANGDELLFLAADEWDEADARRRRAGYRARPIQRGLAFSDELVHSAVHLWRVSPTGGQPQQITSGDLRVSNFEESPRGNRIAFTAGPVDRYADGRANEVYLLDTATGSIERLTDNDVGERIIGFSPDGDRLAIAAPREFRGNVSDVYVRPVTGGEWTPVTSEFDNDISAIAWMPDGAGFRFVGADGVNRQLFTVSTQGGAIQALTDIEGVISFYPDASDEVAVLRFTDPRTPADIYVAPWNAVGDRDRWTRLTDINPWVASIQLAEYETVRWTSPDGTEVEGILTYPLDYDPNRSYPLITDIHGGPAAAYENMFDPTQGRPQRGYMHLMAAHGYAVFRPNYRGSSNYGEQFKAEIAGDYWTRATEDIHAGIDQLIDRGIAHPDSLGFMGWSAGGHWSNWMLVTTDRFKAISSGAGVGNWVSLYGQTDNQSSREFYLGGTNALGEENRPWDDYDHWWDESPLKYISNATTPTLFHYGERDERIPMPQGQELHMALKGLGVPTEFIVYPGEPHGLREPTNQLVKMMSEMGWFDMWIRGADSWLDWAEVLEVGEAIEAALSPE